MTFTKSVGLLKGTITTGAVSSTRKSVADKVEDLVGAFGKVSGELFSWVVCWFAGCLV